MEPNAAIRIDGEPVLFQVPSTQTEVEWRERIQQACADVELSPQTGLRLDFIVSSWRRRGQRFDLDNLAKPVLDALGHPEVRFIDARIDVGPEPGVAISVIGELPAVSPTFCMQDLTLGSVKRTEGHPALRGVPPFAGDRPLRVQLTVHERASITDFGFTGFVKPTLDRLWPVIGGTSSRPHDHRIRHLIVTRSAERPSGVTVGIEAM